MILNKLVSPTEMYRSGDSSVVMKVFTQVNTGSPGDTGTLIAAEFDAINNAGTATRTIAVKATGDINLAAGNLVFPDGSVMNSNGLIWNASNQYIINSITNYLGTLYTCTAPNSNKQPDISTSYWTKASANAAFIAPIGTYVNQDFETGVTGWTSSTGFSITSQSGTVLSGNKSGMLSKIGSNRFGDTIHYPFTINAMDKSSVMQITFAYRAGDSYITGDSTFTGNFAVSIFDVTNSVTITPTITYLPAGKEKHGLLPLQPGFLI